MSGIEIEHKQSSISSVRSTVSTASSGFAIVTGTKPTSRKCIPLYTPLEPPPDYDADVDVSSSLLGEGCREKENMDMSGETTRPLLEEPVTRTVTESSQQNKNQTVVRINSSLHDVRIEVESTQLSPSSTSGDATFLYDSTKRPQPNNRREKERRPKCTKRERCMCVSLATVATLLLLTVIAIVLYFLVFKDT